MNNIDQYAPYIMQPGTGSIVGAIHYGLWFVFVYMPFQALKMFVQLIVFLLNLLDLKEPLGQAQTQFISTSKQIFLNFIGGRFGVVTTGSVAFVFVGIAALWGFYEYKKKGSFMSSLGSLFFVLILGFFYYGNVNNNQTGGEWAYKTVQQTTTTMQNKFSQALTGTNYMGSDGGVTQNFGDYLENYVLKSTANFVNSGATDGSYGSGNNKGKLDYKKLSGSNSQDYIDSIQHDNLYLMNIPDYLMSKLIMVNLGFINALVFITPVSVMILATDVMQMLLLLLILVFPVVLLLSLIPSFRNAGVEVFKKMIVLTALPTFFGVVLTVFFWLNSLIDTWVVARFSSGALSALNTGFVLSNGLGVLVQFVALFLIKVAIFYFGIWKHKGQLLSVISGGRLNEVAVQLETTEQKVRDVTHTATQKVVGTGEVAVGAFTGNAPLMLQGAQMVAPDMTSKAQAVYNRYQSSSDTSSEDDLSEEKQETETAENNSVETEQTSTATEETYSDFEGDNTEINQGGEQFTVDEITPKMSNDFVASDTTIDPVDVNVDVEVSEEGVLVNEQTQYKSRIDSPITQDYVLEHSSGIFDTGENKADSFWKAQARSDLEEGRA
jgi:hypothetical protein